MRAFAIGLGVRCHHCHLGEESQPLAEFDFASDEKATKRKAREMLRMVKEINDQHLAGLAKYAELRERYYGSHTFDFREFVLVSVAQDLWEEGQREAAAAFASLNLEHFPSSGSTYTLLGQAYADLGNREQAIAHLEKALDINPRNRAAQRTLDGLKSQN